MITIQHDMKSRFAFIGMMIVAIVASSFTQKAEEVLYQGTWEANSSRITFKGSWKIVKDGDKNYVVLGDNFSARKAPDLKIFFSKASLDDISGKNATKLGSPVLVAKLTSYKGQARYEIPGSIAPSDYATIIIHCEQYSKLWGGSSLK